MKWTYLNFLANNGLEAQKANHGSIIQLSLKAPRYIIAVIFFISIYHIKGYLSGC